MTESLAFLVAKIDPMIIGASIKNILSRIEKKLTFFNHLKKNDFEIFTAHNCMPKNK